MPFEFHLTTRCDGDLTKADNLRHLALTILDGECKLISRHDKLQNVCVTFNEGPSVYLRNADFEKENSGIPYPSHSRSPPFFFSFS